MLSSGSHITLTPDPAVSRRAPQAFIAPSLLSQLLASEFGRTDLTLVPGSNPLLIRADEETTARLRTILADLGSAGDALNIQIEATLSSGATDNLSNGPNTALTTWSGSCRSGDLLSFGAQSDRRFVGGFNTEVASESGVADPLSSSALYGECLHLTSCRVLNGSAVHIEGLLDIGYHTGTETFDPDTPDLGIVQQLEIRFIQVAFSGICRPGQPLTVEIDAAAAPIGSRLLSILATTSPDPEPKSAGWNLRDLSYLSSKGHALEVAQPGLREDRMIGHASTKAAQPVISPGSLSGLLTERSSIGSEQGRVHATERLLVIPASNRSALARADELISALETELLNERRLTITHEGLSVSLPTTHGRTARILDGVERPYLTGYSSEIASNSWMPGPITETCFDGFCLTGHSSGEEFQARWWVAKTTEVLIADEETAHMGSLQQPTRIFSAGIQRQTTGSERVIPLDAGSLSISVK